MTERVLVTGGAGYVGSMVVDELLRSGHRVRAVDALLHGTTPSLLSTWGLPGFEFLRGDLRDPAVRRAALRDVGSVVHLAAVVGDPACSRQPELATEINLDMSLRLLEDAQEAGVDRFVFASTCSNYGRRENGDLATEESDLSPISLYAETKVAVEQAIREHRNGLAPACLRFATVFGASPRMRFDLTVNEFARDVALGRDLVVFGEQFWRPYIHVRDAARAVRLVLEADREAVDGETFNAGDTSENYRKLDIVEILRERFPDASVSFVHRDEDPRDYRVSFERIRTRLSFEAERSVADGIDEICALLSSGLVSDPDAPAYRN